MSLASANVSYPAHVRMHQHQPSQPYAHPHHLDTSPTISHESLPSKLGNSSPPHSLSPMEPSLHHPHQHHHHHYHQQQQQPSSYHHSQAPYQAPTPPYNPRSNSIDLAQKPTLPYPRRLSHSYAPSHPYSPPTLPPLTNHLPPSPQSPVDSGSLHYPMLSNNRDDRALSSYQHYRSSMSSSPPPSSSGAASATSPSATTASGLPLSATDRRERNKAASAKYRAKKHYQSGEMRQQINVLQDQNNVLTRQLDESRTENASLKHLVEKLKGRLVAEKVLKRLREVGREKKKKKNNTKRRLNGSKTVSSLAHLAAASDSEDDHDDEEDDSDLVGDVDVDDDEEEDAEDAELQRRQNERKPNTRRRVTRVEDNDDDDDYLEN